MIAPGVNIPWKWISAAAPILGGLIWWGVKKFFGRLQAQWDGVIDMVKHIQETQITQVENHLEHIELNGNKHTELLTEIASTQKELNGYLRGLTAGKGDAKS